MNKNIIIRNNSERSFKVRRPYLTAYRHDKHKCCKQEELKAIQKSPTALSLKFEHSYSDCIQSKTCPDWKSIH